MMAVLDKLSKKFGTKSDDDVASELEAAKQEIREFRRAHQRFRDRAHVSIDASIEAGKRWVEGELRRFATIQKALEPVRGPDGQLPFVVQHAPDWSALAETWHRLADEAAGFSELTFEQFTGEEQKRLRTISELEVEIERRRVAAERAAADRELAELEERVST